MLRTLRDSASILPPEFASHRVLPSLISALEFGGANATIILPLALQMGKHVPSAEYSTILLTPIAKMYASPDRGTRMALLDNLSEYVDKLDQKYVTDKVWQNLQTGFADTIPAIREATVKSIGLLYPKFNDRIMNNDLLRQLSKMQLDPESSIRTNTCILIGRIAPSLGYNTKKKVLIPAFHRALKDTFVHARVAGLMSFMATMECFDADDMATKVIPCISFTLIDNEKLVRDQAFKAVELFLKKLESHASTMPETMAQQENGQLLNPMSSPLPASQTTLVNSAAGAAGALAGWAMSSLSKKLVPGDLQSTMSSLTLDRSISAPPSTVMNGGSDSKAKLPSLGITPSASTFSSPGLPSSSAPKSLKLGANKHKAVVPSLADALATEVENDAGSNAWGSDDLMDVNADEDDWNSFESAPASSKLRPTSGRLGSTSAAGLGFDDVAIPMSRTPEITVDDEWGDMDPGSNQIQSNAISTWNATYVRPPSPLSRPLSPLSRPAQSRQSASHTSPKLRPSSPKLAPRATSPSPVNAASLSKEDKAAEMARRKEERKQRIAQLKEQKKLSGAKA